MDVVPPIADHSDRDRAESFGAVAHDYDRYRTSYPDALFADLVDLAPRRTLDVACGTGKVAVALLACGLAVLGVEADPAMAAVARSHGVLVEVGRFETWDPEDRRFGLVTCGQAWHWIDPDLGARKAAEVLEPGGTLALFWNYDRPDEEIEGVLDEVYARHAPDVQRPGSAHRASDEDNRYTRALEAVGAFESVTKHSYKWERNFDAEEWVGRAVTFSDHVRLPEDTRAALSADLHAAIAEHGDAVTVHGGTFTILARTKGA